MSILTADHYFSIENPISSFVGSHTVQVDVIGSSDTADGTTLDVPLIDGKLDRTAISNFGTNGRVRVRIFYAQVGSNNLVRSSDANTQVVDIYDNGVFNEDINGNLFVDGGSRFYLEGTTTAGTFSFLARIRSEANANEQTVYGSLTDINTKGLVHEDGSTFGVSNNLGSPVYFKNGASITLNNKDVAYHAIVDADFYNMIVANGTLPTLAANDFSVNGSDRALFGFGQSQAWALWYSNQSGNAATIQTELENLYNPPSIPTGIVTFPSGAIYSGRRTWLEAPYAGKGDAVITGHSDIVAGQTTSPTERDPTKEVFALDRGMSNDFSGTLTGVAGTTLSTGLDLTGVNIGGVNDYHYIFRATAGAGVGEEVTVIDRSGGDIIVNTNPGFTTGTEFVLGKLLKGVSKILPKD